MRRLPSGWRRRGPPPPPARLLTSRWAAPGLCIKWTQCSGCTCQQQAYAPTLAGLLLAPRLQAVLPQAAALSLLRRCARLAKAEPTLLRISPPSGPGAELVVVGDLHGQFHDLLTM